MNLASSPRMKGLTHQQIIDFSFHKIVEEIDDYAVILLDLEGNIQNWNMGAQKMKGYSAQEILGKNFDIFYPAEDKAAHLPEKLLSQARISGKAKHEGWRVRKDGSLFYGNIVITAIHNDAREVIAFIKLTKDLTDLRNMEIKLRANEVRFHQMVMDIQDYAILLLSPDGIIENWNKGAEKIKGYTEAEIVGKSFRLFYPEKDRTEGRPEELIREATENGTARDEGWRVRKDGSVFWASVVLTALYDDRHNILGFSKVTRNLTEKKKIEDTLSRYTKELELKNKELEQFTFIASHDLQEPLNTISSFVDIIKTDFSEQFSDEVLQFLKYIHVATERMRTLVRSLLDYGRIGLNPKLESVDCNQLVASVLDDLQAAVKNAGVEVKVNSLPVIEAYPIELRSLFQNLISNAIKYRRKSVESYVIVNAERKETEWVFLVEDNGIGIDKKYFDKIFAIFYRLHRSEEFDGVGIGLAHCRKIIELHGGRLWVDSEFDKGSRFIFSIPDQNEL